MKNSGTKANNQAVRPQSAKGKTDAEYSNYKVIVKEGGSTMILSSGLSKVNAVALCNRLSSFVNNKHKDIVGAGKTSCIFKIIH